MLELLFFTIVLIQVFFYAFFFSRFAFSKIVKQKSVNKELPISVIICANNEAENIKGFLPFIINQKYKNFEIVLVNDHSTDDTLKIMNAFKEKHSNISIVDLSDVKSNGNKKIAVTQGIKSAKNEYLLFTDADCKPNSKYWISEMSSHFNDNKKIVLGYGAYRKINNSWLNKLIRFETILTAIQYFSYAKVNLAYMGVGRNLAYTKSLFKSVNGFESHKDIKSGDDDLFINQVANNNVSCCYTKESYTISEPHVDFNKWIYQKRRHISTATTYRNIHKVLLGLFYVSQFLFWGLSFYFLITDNFKGFILYIFILRIILQYIIFGFSSKKLNEKDLILYLPFLELFLIIIQMRIFIQNLFSKPTNW